MFRVEVIGNKILLQDFLEQLEKDIPHQFYTVLPVLRAKGKRGKANGDNVWMDENFLCLMFVRGLADTRLIEAICKAMKTVNTKNSLTLFVSDSNIANSI